MISATKHLENYYGNKERAVADLEKWLVLYENSPRRHTPKVIKRIEDYKTLLAEINAI